jgi:hypothetical protein
MCYVADFMNSNLDTLFGVLSQLLHHLNEQLGWLGWVMLGVFMLACMLTTMVVLRWILRGGIGPGATRRFFAERQEIEHWLKHR